MNWISVKDSLPKDCITVLINSPKEYYIGYFGEDNRWCDVHDNFIANVTHWSVIEPLPEPPE